MKSNGFALSAAMFFAIVISGCTVSSDRHAPPGAQKEPGAAPSKVAPPKRLDQLSMNDALELAAAHNPALAAARKNIDQASARIVQAGLLPNPVISIDAGDIPQDPFSFSRSSNSISLEQDIVVSGRLSAQESVAGREKDIASLEYESAMLAVLGETRVRFLRVLAVDERLKTARGNLEISGELHKTSKTRVEAGVAMATDEIKARLELNQAELTVAALETQARTAKLALNTIMGLPRFEAGRYEGALADNIPERPLEQFRELMLKNNPELLALNKQGELAGARLGLARAERIPDISVRFGYGRMWEEIEKEDGSTDSTHTNFSMMGLSIPLPLFNTNQGAIMESEAAIEAASFNSKARENELLLALEEKYSLYAQMVGQVKAYKENIMPDANQVLELVKIGYEEGKFSYLDLLDAQRTLADIRQAYVDVLEELNVSAAEMETLCGKPSAGSK
jgi:cobalt-zinc-cadmium efflux system outer membrane protein